MRESCLSVWIFEHGEEDGRSLENAVVALGPGLAEGHRIITGDESISSRMAMDHCGQRIARRSHVEPGAVEVNKVTVAADQECGGR